MYTITVHLYRDKTCLCFAICLSAMIKKKGLVYTITVHLYRDKICLCFPICLSSMIKKACVYYYRPSVYRQNLFVFCNLFICNDKKGLCILLPSICIEKKFVCAIAICLSAMIKKRPG